MLVGDVGHHRHVEIDRGHAALVQAVRGGLQHGGLAAGVAHLRQVALHVGRVGRGDVEPGVQRPPGRCARRRC